MKIKIEEKILQLKNVNLDFIDINLKDLFKLKNNKTLLETLKHKKYQLLNSEEFNNELETPLGLFLESLKSKGNEKYKLFLNKYGDMEYCKFKISDKEIEKLKGIYFYILNDEIVYIGRCCDSFYKRINNGYGRISPKNCYKDGQQTNCHINNLINKNKDNIEFWIYPMDNVEEIKNLEIKLIKEYKPEWNVALVK